MVGIFQLFFAVTTLVAYTAGQEHSCPSWNVSCICKSQNRFDKAILYCDSTTHKVFITAGMCVSMSSSNNKMLVGDCPYIPIRNVAYYNNLFKQLPENRSELNTDMCGPFNRRDFLCSSCVSGFGVSVYSFGLPCAKCHGLYRSLFLYILLELAPITVMYIIMFLFSIRATQAPMACFVFMSHTIILALRESISLHSTLAYSTESIHKLLHAVLFLSGVWNLDSFRFIIPPFCISERINNIQAVALEYVSALYPLILVLLTFLMIELQSRNVRPIVWLWKPFHKCLVHFRRTWDIRRSTINTFSTFLLLSYFKMIFVSFKLLHQTSVYDINGTVISSSLQVQPNVEYFGPEHLPFGLIAIAIITIFTVPPIFLLVLYPTRLFQKFLRRCRCRATQAVHMFVDTYQGCFKDGTNGTRDYRALSALYLVLRFVLLSLYVQHREIYNNGLILIIFGVLFMLLSLLLALLRPYKADYMTCCEAALLFLLGSATLLTYIWFFFPYSYHDAILLGVVCLLPHVVFIGYVVYILIQGKKILKWSRKNIGHYLKPYESMVRHLLRSQSTIVLEEDLEESLPDRFANPENYLASYSTSYQLKNDSTEL